jgi:hypothetical protein
MAVRLWLDLYGASAESLPDLLDAAENCTLLRMRVNNQASAALNPGDIEKTHETAGKRQSDPQILENC